MRRKLFRAGKANGLAASVIALVVVAAGRASAASFTPGDLVVSVYGNPSGRLTDGAPAPINLIEYSTSGGSSVLVDALPQTNGVDASNNLGVVGEYGSASEGFLQLSGNGADLTLAGYSASAAAAGIDSSTIAANGASNSDLGKPFGGSTVELAQSTDTNVPRVGVLVDASGNVNSSTELNDVYNINNPRSLYSANGSTFYISGQGDGNNSDQGIFYGPTGLNTVTSPGTPPTGIYNAEDTRFVTAFNSNLYYSIDTSSGKHTGIWEFSGLPTGSATATQIVPGNNGKTGSSEVFYSPESFYFANADTLYVADSGDPKAGTTGPGDGGIQKWTYNGSNWTLEYTLLPATSGWVPTGNPDDATSGQSGFEDLTGEVVGTGVNAKVDLFAVSYTLGHDDPNGLYAIADTLDATSGSGETFTELESAAGDGAQVFKGVSFAPVSVPEPASLTLLSVGGVALLSRRKGNCLPSRNHSEKST